MLISAITAILITSIGVYGNKGTLKGLWASGSFLRKARRENMEIIYNIKAPKTEMVMISSVLPVSKISIPIHILKSRAM